MKRLYLVQKREYTMITFKNVTEETQQILSLITKEKSINWSQEFEGHE